MHILDGNALSQEIKNELREKVKELNAAGKRSPHLVAVLVGDNPASKSYVNNKVKSCFEVGYRSTLIHHPEEITQHELINIVKELNEDPEVDGFIVQLPLPKHIW